MEREQATKFIFDLLGLMISKKGADLFISADFPPAIKIDGQLIPISQQALTPAHTLELAMALMNERQAAAFEQTKESNFAVNLGALGRFRVSAYVQMGRVSMVIRTITTKIPTVEELGLPPVLNEIIMEPRGLILVVGATGSGKSTSLAAMIGYRNQNSKGHIMTIEDPIEFAHTHKNCIISHREIGIDTENWEVALKNALRQSPDVVAIGEIRDRETMSYALHFSESGHLCLATLHANNTNQALERLASFFPPDRRQQLNMELSLNLRAIIAMRLIPLKDVKGRCPAVEILRNSPYISDLILKNELGEMKEAIKKSRALGMQTFDQSLFDLYEDDKISYEDALRNADSVNDLRLAIKLRSKKGTDTEALLASTTSISLGI